MLYLIFFGGLVLLSFSLCSISCLPSVLLSQVHGHVGTVVDLLCAGANVNILTDSGMSCLSACYHLAYCIHGNRAASPGQELNGRGKRPSVLWSPSPAVTVPCEERLLNRESRSLSESDAAAGWTVVECSAGNHNATEGCDNDDEEEEEEVALPEEPLEAALTNGEALSTSSGLSSTSSLFEELEFPDTPLSPDITDHAMSRSSPGGSKFLPSAMSRLPEYIAAIQPPPPLELRCCPSGFLLAGLLFVLVL